MGAVKQVLNGIILSLLINPGVYPVKQVLNGVPVINPSVYLVLINLSL